MRRPPQRSVSSGALRRGFKGARKTKRHAPTAGITSLTTIKAGRRRKLW